MRKWLLIGVILTSGLPTKALAENVWECTFSTRNACDSTGSCRPINASISSVRIFADERAYLRCDRGGCDEWRGTFTRSGGFLNVELQGRAAFAKMSDDLSFTEVVTLGHMVIVSHGRCQEGLSPIQRPRRQ